MVAIKKEIIEKNHYADNVDRYISKGLSVIPDKYMSKQPAIKGWSDYCYKMPSKEEIISWKRNFQEANIAICLGSESKIIALDIDCDDQEILDIIMPILPESPIEKIGSKGNTRFFRFTGESSDLLKFNGSVVVEILSNGKKTTIAPSIHPNGSSYKWKGADISDFDLSKLPILPPSLFAHLGSKLKLAFPNAVNNGLNKINSGRNAHLSSLCGKLIGEGKSVDDVVRALLDADKKENEIPLFSDPEEMRHTHDYTNALSFYSNHLGSINTKRFRESKEFEMPIFQTVADLEIIKELRLKKLQNQESQKSSKNKESLPVNTVKEKMKLPEPRYILGEIIKTINDNSWVLQPDLAFGAALTLMSVLVSRKLVFQGMSPNLYVLNVAPSGSGKDSSQQFVKKTLIDLRADSLLGSGDYVSDASLMDSLANSPVRLDIMDEAGGILKSVNSGRSDYGGKMADILAELYTSSNSKYLGRATAEGNKGACYRPNVNILASTTPTGFTEGVSLKALEKGLLGRFLIFQGSSNTESRRLKDMPDLASFAKDHLLYWYGFNSESSDTSFIGGIKQLYTELSANNSANKRLDEIFKEFDALRRSRDHRDPILPIIARLYQQMIKLVIIHSASRVAFEVPIISLEDVNFGYETIKYFFSNVEDVINRYVFANPYEKELMTILNIIRDDGEISKRDLAKATRYMKLKERENILKDLIDSEVIIKDFKSVDGITRTVFIYIGE